MNRYVSMVRTQCATELRRTARNRRFVFLGILMPILLYFIFTSAIGDDKQVGGADWKLYYLISMTAFGILGSSLYSLGPRISQERSEGWARWLQTTPLPNSAYLLSKIAAQAMIHIAIIVIMFGVGAFAKGISIPFYEWLQIGLWLVFGMMPFMALGTLLGSFKSPEAVQVVASVLQMSLGVLGGLWFPMESMPDWMQQLAKALPSFRFGQGAWDIVGGHSIRMETPAILVAYTLGFLFLTIWRMRAKGAAA